MLKVTVEHSNITEGITGECQEQESFPSDLQNVVFAVNQLEDGVTRSDFYIQKESTLHFNVRSPGGAMQIFLESLEDHTLRLGVESSCALDAVKIKIPPKKATTDKIFEMRKVTVEHSDTTEDVTEKYQEQERIPSDLQNVVFAVNQLENGVTRSDFNIQKESTILFNVRSPGGAMLIFVESIDDQAFRLRVESSCAIDAVKIKIPRKKAVEIQPARLMHITAKSLCGQVYSLDVDPGYTIGRVKALIARKYGTMKDYIRLIYDGRSLRDVLTLEEYSIQENATFHFIFRLPGGCSEGYEEGSSSESEDEDDFVEVEYLDGVKPVEVKK